MRFLYYLFNIGIEYMSLMRSLYCIIMFYQHRVWVPNAVTKLLMCCQYLVWASNVATILLMYQIPVSALPLLTGWYITTSCTLTNQKRLTLSANHIWCSLLYK